MFVQTANEGAQILTGVHGAVSVDGGQDAGKWIRTSELDRVPGQEFELLRCDWRESIKLEGEVNVVGPVSADACRWCSVRNMQIIIHTMLNHVS